MAPAAAVAGGDVNIDFVYEHARDRSRASAASRVRRVALGAASQLLERQHADDAAARAVILELDRAVDLGKQRVVLAEADVQARAELAARAAARGSIRR